MAGTVTADDFYSGTRAAVAGGTTCIVDFATQYKGETLEEALENWNKKAEGRCSCDYGFHMAISDLEGAGETQVQAMIDAGVSTFKLYMTYPDMLLRDGELYRILKQLKKQGGIAGVHCENAEVIDALTAEAKAAGHLGPDTHPRVRPAGLEAEAVNRLLAIAKEADAPVIVVHLTCWEAFAKIQRARARGQIVFAETCPQYLLLDESCYKKNGFEAAKYVCSPPLRKKGRSGMPVGGFKNRGYPDRFHRSLQFHSGAEGDGRRFHQDPQRYAWRGNQRSTALYLRGRGRKE